MTNKKPVGRPRRDDLTTQLKFNVDTPTANSVKQLAATSSRSQADILRELVPIVSSKDFEGMLPNIALEQLQKLSDDCWKQLHMPNSIFETDNLSEYMPAFITTWEPPVVYVKYPTYKIHIYDKTDPTNMTNQLEVEKILSTIPPNQRSQAAYAPVNYLVPRNGMHQIANSFVNEVMCLCNTLAENKKTKDNITQLLEDAGYAYSVYPAYCIWGEYIELIDDGKYFRINPYPNYE